MTAGDRWRVGRSAHTPDGQSDDRDKWMTLLTAMDDEQMDALLSGTAPIDALAPIADVVQRLRRSVRREPVPPMGEALRAQLAAAPVVPLAVRRARGSLVKAAAAAVAAAFALVGAGAAQNRLPSGMQDVVSSTAHLVGLDVPTSHEDDDDDDDDDGETPVETTGGNGGEPGYEGTTPGGATPADPGTPGDQEPATPATPPEDPGNQDGNGRNDTAPNSTVPAGPQGGPHVTSTDTTTDTVSTSGTGGSGKGNKG